MLSLMTWRIRDVGLSSSLGLFCILSFDRNRVCVLPLGLLMQSAD